MSHSPTIPTMWFALVLIICGCTPSPGSNDAEVPSGGSNSDLTFLESRALNIASCMVGSGFPAVADGNAIEFGELPNAQGEAQQEALADCETEFPLPEGASDRYSDDGWLVVYEHFVDNAIPCLEQQGHTVDDPPPFDVFVAQGQPDLFFNPVLTIQEQLAAQRDFDGANEIADLCPPGPPLEDILGDR